MREEGDPPGIHAGTFHYAVPQGVKDPELAWELVKWLTLNEETAGYFMFEQDRPSPVIAFSRNPAYWDGEPVLVGRHRGTDPGGALGYVSVHV